MALNENENCGNFAQRKKVKPYELVTKCGEILNQRT
jgi:hypothetical protein